MSGLRRGLVLAAAMGCALLAIVCAAAVAVFIVTLLTAPDGGGDLWLVLPIFIPVIIVDAGAVAGAIGLFGWWRRTASISSDDNGSVKN